MDNDNASRPKRLPVGAAGRTPVEHAANGNFRAAVAVAAGAGLDTLGLQDPEEVAVGGITIGIFGEQGAGKTALGMTAIDYFKRTVHPGVKTLVCDAEGGLRTVVSRRDFKFKTITSWEQFVKVTNTLAAAPNLREVYPVITVDNLSELSEMSMLEVCRAARVDEPGWPEWRKNSRIVVGQIRKLRDAARMQRCCVVVNLWAREDSDTGGNVRKVSVELNPALAKLFNGAVDIVGYLEVDDEGRRIIHLGQNSRIKAKFRQDMLDPTIRGIPLDLWGPKPPDIFSLEPLLATLIGGEPFPVSEYAMPQGAKPGRFASNRPVIPATTPGDVAANAALTAALDDA